SSCTAGPGQAISWSPTLASGRLQIERDGARLVLGERDALAEEAQSLLPQLDRVGTGRKVRDGKATGSVGNRKVGMGDHAGPGAHPAMEVAHDGRHDARPFETRART